MDLTYEVLESKGIDTSMIRACKRIRDLASWTELNWMKADTEAG